MSLNLKRVLCGMVVATMVANVVCFAGTKKSLPFTLANINANGTQAKTGTKTTFNYVLDSKGDFVGSANGTVKNASKLDQGYENVGYLPGLTIVYSLYLVDDSGNAGFTAGGHK